MPFNSSGVYSLASSAFVTGTGIKASPVNMDFIDIGTALSTTYALIKANANNTSPATANRFGGNCRLTLNSASVIKLIPYNGNGLLIQDTLRTIPAAGISLTLSGLTADTLYWVYATWNGTTIVLSLSTTVPAQRIDQGFWVKFGDNASTLVGVLKAATSSTVLDSVTNRDIASWYNPPARTLARVNNAGSVFGTTFQQVGSPVTFVRFATRPGVLVLTGYQFIATATNGAAALAYDTIDIGSLSDFQNISRLGQNTPYTVSGQPFLSTDSTAATTIYAAAAVDSAVGFDILLADIRGWVL